MSNEYIVRTVMSSIEFYDGAQEILEKLGIILGSLRNTDYVALVASERSDAQLTNKQRRDFLLSQGLNMRYADSIIGSNNEQLVLAKRTSKENITDWRKELSTIEKNLNKNPSGKKKDSLIKSKESIEKKISLSENKRPSVCFGGKSLFREYTRAIEQSTLSLELENDFKNKRMFLEFKGQSGYVSGNTMIHVDLEKQELTLNLTQSLAEQIGVEDTRIPLGVINIRNSGYLQNFSYCIENRVSTSYEFVWNRKKQCWRVHVSTRINQSHIEEKNKSKKTVDKNRVCGIDQNSGFITATIIDENGNPVEKRTWYHSSSKDVQDIVNELTLWCNRRGCYTIGIESLKSLSGKKRRSSGSFSGVNRVVSLIPYGKFRTCLLNKSDFSGIEIVEVNPYRTSKNTSQWKEDCFGITIHEKASYLIARRTLGLSISRKHRQRTSRCAVGVINNGLSLPNTTDDSTVNDYSTCSDRIPVENTRHLTRLE